MELINLTAKVELY